MGRCAVVGHQTQRWHSASILAHEPTVDDETVGQVIASLRRTPEPAVAFALEAPLFAWSAKVAQRHVVARLADRALDDRLLRMALDRRNVLAASVGPELRSLLARGGTATGRAAAMLDDREAITRVLQGHDIPAILGLLHACAVSDRRGLDRTVDWVVSVHVAGPRRRSDGEGVAGRERQARDPAAGRGARVQRRRRRACP